MRREIYGGSGPGAGSAVRAWAAETTLTELGRRARRGDGEALDALLRQLQAPVQRFLVRRLSGWRDPADVAGDLGQEVLIRALGALPRTTFVDDRRLVAWVLMIARHVLVDHLRAERSRREITPPEGLEAAAERASLARWHLGRGQAARPLVQELAASAAAELPEGTRELLRLRLHAGYTWKQVGEALRISESAAKRRFQRARDTVHRRMLARLDALPPAQRERALRALGQSPCPTPLLAPAPPWPTS